MGWCRKNGLTYLFSVDCYFLWHPGSEKPECPVFQPRYRGEVFWNMALLSIEQITSLLQHGYEYKVSDITMNNTGTATLRQLQLLYASSITTRGSRTSTGSGTTNDDDGLQL